jgi:hypothetical protein
MQFFNSGIRSRACHVTCKKNVKRPDFYSPYDNDTLTDLDRDPNMVPSCTQTENNFEDPHGIVANETTEQTLRMMRLHLDATLKSKRSPDVNIAEYEYFQSARQIFEKVCPEAEAPPLLLRSLLRMFRLAVK